VRRLRFLILLPLAGLLSGCNFVVLDPSGDVAVRQRDLLVVSTGLMLLIIIPVMALTVVFAWRYRARNQAARYEPDWEHSTKLELVIWAAPLLIIICLGALTWLGTHLLDPYRSLDRIGPGRPAVAQGETPLNVEVVALDWKWLFIYPDYGIATVNDLAAPVNRPINFKVTSASVMNAFYIPALAGQIYAMAGMETKLHAVINQPGTYVGFSSNYSGAGFSGMHFAFHGLSSADFDQWVAKAKASGASLDRPDYLQLERPSQNVPVMRYASVDPSLYDAILNMCVNAGTMCLNQMAAIDAAGGLGPAGIGNTVSLGEDTAARGAKAGATLSAVANICTTNGTADAPVPAAADVASGAARRDLSPIRGYGLARPNANGGGRPALSQTTPVRLPAAS
jgi:cytochrome o ubiquinol oxidase subunit 2